MANSDLWMEERLILVDVSRTRLALIREPPTAEIVIPLFAKKPTSICLALAVITLKTSEITCSRMVLYHGFMVM